MLENAEPIILYDEVARCHASLRIIKTLLKDGKITLAYVETCQALDKIPSAFEPIR